MCSRLSQHFCAKVQPVLRLSLYTPLWREPAPQAFFVLFYDLLLIAGLSYGVYTLKNEAHIVKETV